MTDNYPAGVSDSTPEIYGDDEYEKWIEAQEEDLEDFVGGFLENNPEFLAEMEGKDRENILSYVLQFIQELHYDAFLIFLTAKWPWLVDDYDNMPFLFVSEMWPEFTKWANAKRITIMKASPFIGSRSTTVLWEFYKEIQDLMEWEKYEKALWEAS